MEDSNITSEETQEEVVVETTTETPEKETKVMVVADEESGQVIVPSKNNPEYGCIRVIQKRIVIDENGFLRMKPLSALIPGLLRDLQVLGWRDGQELEGKIVITESIEPFNKSNPERDYKMAGKTGVLCVRGEDPIYRRLIYTMNSATQDTLVKHTNVEEIRDAYAETEAEGSATAEQDLEV